MRAAVNIRGGADITQAIMRMGLSLCELLPISTGDVCPVAAEIKGKEKLFRAYHHPGAFAVEPTITLLATTPLELVSTLTELSRLV